MVENMDVAIEFSNMTASDLDLLEDTLICEFDDFWSFKTLEDELNHPNSKYIVAKIGNDIVGFAGLRIVFDSADIMNIVVKKSNRLNGLGTLLLKNIIDIASENGVKLLTLEVNVNNLPAIHIYEKLGFEQIAIRKKYYNNEFDAKIMQLTLE